MPVLILQALEAPTSFWPTTADSWLSLLSAIIAVVVTIGTLLYRTARLQTKLEEKINGLGERTNEKFKEQGERIGGAELNCKAHGTALEELRRKDIQTTLQIDTNTREVTRSVTETEMLDKAFHQHLREAGQIEIKIRERMARIEERLQIPPKRDNNNG